MTLLPMVARRLCLRPRPMWRMLRPQISQGPHHTLSSRISNEGPRSLVARPDANQDCSAGNCQQWLPRKSISIFTLLYLTGVALKNYCLRQNEMSSSGCELPTLLLSFLGFVLPYIDGYFSNDNIELTCGQHVYNFWTLNRELYVTVSIRISYKRRRTFRYSMFATRLS